MPTLITWRNRRLGGNKSEETDQASGTEDKNEQGNSDEEQQQDGPPAPVGYWDHRLKHVRHEAWLKWTITTAVLMAFILAILSIYWAALFRIPEHLDNLGIYVVDMDGVAPYNTDSHDPVVGPIITNIARQMLSSGSPTLGFEFPDPSRFNNDPIQVRQAIYDFDAWAAIIINPNATALLYSAIENGNTSYDPMGACQLVYVEARDSTNWFDILGPMLSSYTTEATSQVGREWTRMVMQNATNNDTLVRNALQVPQALSPAIGFSEYNLRPFYPYQIIPSISIGLIYLIIVSFFSFPFYLPIHFKYLKPEGHPPLKFHQLVLWRWCATISAYFMLSLAYSLISLAFQVNFTGSPVPTSQTSPTQTSYGNPAAYGMASFVIYWMLNLFGMIALGLASENMSMIIGQPWTGLWLIFWVITNVSTAFYDISIEPRFFQWGYAWPLHYVVEGSRSILFDLHSNLGVDFAVLIAWGVVNTLLFPCACYFMRWKSRNGVHEYYT